MIGFVNSGVVLGQSRFTASRCDLTKGTFRRVNVPSMALGVGDELPMDVPLNISGDVVTVKDVFGGKKVAVCALPGALTPTCLSKHAPGFVESAEKFRQRGVNDILVLSVNDHFVMDVFGKQLDAKDKVKMVADGGAKFTKAVGLIKDTGDFGGLRSARYSMLVDNGTIKFLNVDTSGLEKSTAENLLKEMDEKEDSLEIFCRDSPEADECRTYDD